MVLDSYTDLKYKYGNRYLGECGYYVDTAKADTCSSIAYIQKKLAGADLLTFRE